MPNSCLEGNLKKKAKIVEHLNVINLAFFKQQAHRLTDGQTDRQTESKRQTESEKQRVRERQTNGH